MLTLIESDGLSIGGGPPYFVTSLLDHPDCTARAHAHFTTVGLGGSTVPAAVTRRLADLGIFVFRSYGSTEHPSITGSRADRAGGQAALHRRQRRGPAWRSGSDRDGEIFSRGPDLCLGYTDPELTAKAFDDDGWYRTGDVGVLDDDGYLTITDRKADVIIRGGENISALEVEEVLLGMPGVAEAVVVAAPDDRLGERAAAVLRMQPGHAMPTLDEVRAHFEAAGWPRQKWPEELHEVDDFPRTASGKVQKYKVRKDISAVPAKKLVLGASGFLGSHVTRKLVEAGDDVRVMLRKTSSTKAIDDLDVERCYGDLFDDDALRTAMTGCDVIYYCVVDARMWLRDPAPLFRTNVEGLGNVLDIACEFIDADYGSSCSPARSGRSGSATRDRSPRTIRATGTAAGRTSTRASQRRSCCSPTPGTGDCPAWRCASRPPTGPATGSPRRTAR